MVAVKSRTRTILCRHTGEPVVCLFVWMFVFLFVLLSFFFLILSSPCLPSFIFHSLHYLTLFSFSVNSSLEVQFELSLYPLCRFILELYSFKFVISALNRLLLHQRYPPVNFNTWDTQSSISGFLMEYS